MRRATAIELNAEQKQELERLAGSGISAQRLVERAIVVLLASEGQTNEQIADRLGISRQKAGRWRDRFATDGLAGIEHDLPGRGRKATITAQQRSAVVRRTTQKTPLEQTHWSTRTMAAATGLGATTIRAIWHEHGLKPHLARTFKVSNDPNFAQKLEDIVGLYLNAPEHALVLSCDEKSQVQALDRTQPGLPLKKGRAATFTHDYKRHGTTTLFAALNVADGTVISTCQQRHRHQEWLKFLKLIDATTPPEKQLHLIVDNYATHKHARVQAWLQRHPRFVVHFTPTSASWLNMIERFFRDITTKRLRRGVFHSVPDLVVAIEAFVAAYNASPTPFVWTAKAADILAKVSRARKKLNMLHA
jgi:transposase